MRVLVAAEGDGERCTTPSTWRAQGVAASLRRLGLDVVEWMGRPGAPLEGMSEDGGVRFVTSGLVDDFDRGSPAFGLLNRLRRQLRRLVHREGIDLVHGFGGTRWATALFVASQQSSIPFIWEMPPGTARPRDPRWLAWARRFDHLVTVSPREQAALLSAGHPRRQVAALEWGTTAPSRVEAFHPDRLVVAGALGPEPALSTLIRAVRRTERPIRLNLPQRAWDSDLEDLRAAGRLSIRPDGMRAFVRALRTPSLAFASSDLGPDRFPELLEAAGAGCAVLSARELPFTWACDPHDPVRLARTLNRLRADPDPRDERLRSIRNAILDQRGWLRVCEPYFEIYDRAFRQRKRSPGLIARASDRWDRLVHAKLRWQSPRRTRKEGLR